MTYLDVFKGLAVATSLLLVNCNGATDHAAGLASLTSGADAEQIFAGLTSALKDPGFATRFQALKAGSLGGIDGELSKGLPAADLKILSADSVTKPLQDFHSSYKSMAAFMQQEGVQEGHVTLAEVRTALSIGHALRTGSAGLVDLPAMDRATSARMVYVSALLAAVQLQRTTHTAGLLDQPVAGQEPDGLTAASPSVPSDSNAAPRRTYDQATGDILYSWNGAQINFHKNHTVTVTCSFDRDKPSGTVGDCQNATSSAKATASKSDGTEGKGTFTSKDGTTKSVTESRAADETGSGG